MLTFSSFLVVGLYVLMTLFISCLVNKRYQVGGNFSTGTKQFGWLSAGVSILATYISALTFVGMPGWVYQSGMQVMSMHLNYPIVIFFAVVFFVPCFYKLGLTSIYEYLEHRFGIYARIINAVIFLVVQCISAGIILYAVSLALVKILPINIFEAIIYISIFTAFYTFAGGITTVIWTDVLQTAVLMVGSIAIFLILLMKTSTLDLLTVEQLSMINLQFDLSVDTTVWAGIVAMSFLHLSVYGTNQLIIQRTLATKCVKTAQKSMMLCGYAIFFVYLFFAIIGLLLNLFYHNQTFENSNDIILDFVFNHTHPLVIGLIIAALAAAAMSTLDSSYNSIATVATQDIYKRFINKNATEEHYDKVARKMSLLAAIVVILPAFLAISNESVLKNIASLASIFVGIRLGSFLLGFFWAKANEKGVIWGSIASVVAVLLVMWYGISWPWYAPVGTFSFLFFGVLVSGFWGSITPKQQVFINNQKQFFIKPTTSHYGLLIFAALVIVLSLIAPNWIHTT